MGDDFLRINFKKLLISVIIPLAIGFFSGFLIRDSVENYGGYVKPPFSPPAGVFAPVWTILYILMGVSTYLILDAEVPKEDKYKALFPYAITLILNFLWPIIFFNFDAYYAAFAIIIALLVWIIIAMVSFVKISPLAKNLMIPYLLWVIFASYLNLGVAILN